MVWLPVWLEESFACRDVLFFAGSMEDEFKDDELAAERADDEADGEAEEEVVDLEEEDVDDLAEEEVEDEDERDDDE